MLENAAISPNMSPGSECELLPVSATFSLIQPLSRGIIQSLKYISFNSKILMFLYSSGCLWHSALQSDPHLNIPKRTTSKIDPANFHTLVNTPLW
jgi:hypothetical protein